LVEIGAAFLKIFNRKVDILAIFAFSAGRDGAREKNFLGINSAQLRLWI
jgi:hypothetical protein